MYSILCKLIVQVYSLKYNLDMKNILLFAKNNKYPIILLLIYIAYTVFTWGKWGDIVFDCFREAILPQVILDGGNLIYRDITCMYPPLAYYVNAFLYMIFGQSLNVLYTVSIIVTLSILSLLYYIIRNKASEITAFTAVFAIMTGYTFRVQLEFNCGSWYFPYSYALIYALMFMIASFVFLVIYKDNKKILNLYLSILFAGISIAFKFDYVLFVIIPVFYVLKTKSFKSILTSFILLTVPFAVELLIFFVLGGNLSDIINEYHLMQSFLKSPSVKVYHLYYLPEFINKGIAKDILLSFILFLKTFCPFFIVSALFQSVISKIKNHKFKILLYGIEFLLLFTILFFIFPVQRVLNLHPNLVFLPTLVGICTLFLLITSVFNKDIPKNNILFFLFLVLTSVLFAIRTPIVMYISNIGNFNIVFYTISIIYFLLEILPKYNIKFIDSNCIKSIFIISLLFYFSTYTLNYLDNSTKFQMDLSKKYVSNKGSMYLDQYYYSDKLSRLMDYIYYNTPEDSTVLIAPEFLIINYFTNRKLPNYKHYNFIMHVVEMYGEENILEDLKKDPPDYYVWTRMWFPYMPGNWKMFGQDFGNSIHEYFAQNYLIVEEIYNDNQKDEDNVYAVVYKRME